MFRYLRFHTRVGLALIKTVLISSAVSSQAEDEAMNVLFIAIDDLKTIGSIYSEDPGNFLQRIYPDASLRREVAARMTPNLQRLADQSVIFMNAYCPAPACNPSRAALMTGIRPHASGLTTNAGGTFFRDYEYEGERHLANATTLPELLQAHGWYTASTGKIYHNGHDFEAQDGNRSWTDWIDVTGQAGRNERSRWSPRSLDWGQEGDDSASHEATNDFRKADFIARVLENGKGTFEDTTFSLPDDQPFFLACGIFRPHLPFYTTKDLLDLFPVEEMTVTQELLETFASDGDDLPSQALKWCGLAVDENGQSIIGSDRFVDILDHGKKIAAEDGDLAGWKDMLKHYFACAAQADRAVGRLLDGLERSGRADRTMVILWSDHGYHLGEKLHETKFTLWDDGAGVNFMIRDPRRSETAGERCYRPVSLIDIYPTVTAMASIANPDPRIAGRDLAALLEEPKASWDSAALSTYQDVSHNMVRTERYKLIRYHDDEREIELYDMEADPEEFHNLAGQAEHAEAERKMKSVLQETLGAGKAR